MLTIESARRARARTGKFAVALAGGGPLGAFYELGALHALSEVIEGRELTEFDVYIGVSSGSLAAAGLANGFDTTTLGAIFIQDEATVFPFSPDILLRPAVGEYVHRVAQLPNVLARVARQYACDPLRSVWSQTVGPLGSMVPTAIFDNEPLERYLRNLFTSEGHTDDFRKLRHRLYIVATNLNTGESVRFGERGRDHVPISRAILASTALPGLYSAVQIDRQFYVDGALIRTLNASIALKEGCDLLIGINPLVPFDASLAVERPRANLADAGLATVLSQTFRALIHSRMKVGMASYHARFPHADILLLEPDRHDETLFFSNVFRYADRRRLVDHAYQCTRRDLRAQSATLARVLKRHGLNLRMDVLRERGRRFSTAAQERSRRNRRAMHRLERALARLEIVLTSPRAAS